MRKDEKEGFAPFWDISLFGDIRDTLTILAIRDISVLRSRSESYRV